ncbi:MAG: hypothetical protein EPO47_09045 [Rugosibacter sp.]|nr:MAG: hypothetical protein EPO60_02570 [Rugosibacter sp.]TBR08342.1 MAG: hypothetical protein EPO47_09045 [Rugosibacter sp.]
MGLRKSAQPLTFTLCLAHCCDYWLLFTLQLSGIAGLWRMEWTPVTRIKLAQKQGVEDGNFKLKELRLQGQTGRFVLENNSQQPVSERILNRENAINLLSSYITKLERTHFMKYYFHIYGFVLDILYVASARACVPTHSIYRSLGC